MTLHMIADRLSKFPILGQLINLGSRLSEHGLPRRIPAMRNDLVTFKSNRKIARHLWGQISLAVLSGLRELTSQYLLSVAAGDLLLLDGRWYVTHSGLLGLARRNRCAGIKVQPFQSFCEPSAHRWAFEATVYKSKTCRGFVGFGDADPSNVSSLVR